MPFKSHSQRRRFGHKFATGEISQEKFDEWQAETDSKKLVERVKPKPKKPKTKRRM